MILTRLILAAAVAATTLGILAPAGVHSSTQDEVAKIVTRLEEGDLVGNWDLIAQLEALGEGVAPILEGALADAGEKAKLGLSKALISLDRRAVGIPVITDLALHAKDTEVRRSAAQILVQKASTADLNPLKKELANIGDPYVKISLARALARPSILYRPAIRHLKELLEFEDFSVRAEAAIALAEIDDIDSGRSILEQIRFEPTARGRLADRLLLDEDLMNAEERVGGLERDDLVQLRDIEIQELKASLLKLGKQIEDLRGQGPSYPLIEELIDKILNFHIDGDLTEKILLDAAAHGMVSHPTLDKFSAYMNEEETQKFRESIRGSYAGIGAVVSMDKKTKLLMIVKPIYSGPAYQAGIRMDDVIINVEGTSTYGQDVQKMVKLIRGEPGSPVTMLINRRGWPEPRTFVIERAAIELPIVYGDLLPGKIGYLRLLHFGTKARKNMEVVLKELEQKEMEALVLDLRGNPGGLLDQAVDVAGLFLTELRTVVTSVGRNPNLAPPETYEGGGPGAVPNYPLIILVDGRSASASEIVSGALQDLDRAILVGETTFGKGSVQRPLGLDTQGTGTLKLTVAEYRLPSGRSIHEKGVKPDILIEPETRDEIDVKAWERLVKEKAFEDYMAEHYDDNRELFTELAEYDGRDTSRYPGFEEWYTSLDTNLSRENVRLILRLSHVRDRVEDERGAEFPLDLQEDIQLQRAVAEALTQIGLHYRDLAEYSFFPDEFPEIQPEEEGPGGVTGK